MVSFLVVCSNSGVLKGGITVKERGRHRRPGVALLLTGLLLIALGLVMVFQVFRQNEDNLLENEDGHLLKLAASVDRSAAGYLSRHAADLSYVVSRRDFLEAESTWLATGDARDLLFRMEEGLVSQYEMSHAMVVVEGETVLLSTNGRTDYTFPFEAGKKGDVSVWPCVDGSGGIWLAFFKGNPSGVVYGSLIDLTVFYRWVAGGLPVEEQEHILLLDAGGQTLIHHPAVGIRVDAVGTLTGENSDYYGLQTLLNWTDKSGTVFYEAHEQLTGQTYTARMAVLPVEESTNGFFTIGITDNYDRFITSVQSSVARMMAFAGLVVAGILLLLFRLLESDRKNDRALRQVAVLQAKNAAMEALNAQTRELAHHQRLETIGTLTSSIAHEFNNLLTPIMGYSILALEKLPPGETELFDSLLEIYEASRKAKDIISRLSDLSRKNTGLAYQYMVPDELVKRVLEVSAPAKPPLVKVRTELGCRYAWLYGNETQLSQVLLNLVLNAFQAMEAGGTLTLSTKAHGHAIIFGVSDTGCGIPEDIRDKIFEPFFTTKETGKGTGLGLAIVRQMVETHQGTIRVSSRVGQGSSFTLTFPLHRRQES